MTSPKDIADRKPVEAMRVARSWSRAPSEREILLPDPWPNMNPIACRMTM